MPYTVPKLTDYSATALEKAAEELMSALGEEAAAVSNEVERKAFRDRWLARKNGILTQINDSWLKGAPKDVKRAAGQLVNSLKEKIEKEVVLAEATLARWEADDQRASPGQSFASMDGALKALQGVDITLPGVRRPIGAEHPVIRTMHGIVGVFQKLGYSVAEGPVVETDYYNFEALNFPPNHPARD